MNVVGIRRYLIPIVTFAFTFLFTGRASAETGGFPGGFDTGFTVEAGYRSDDLGWNIAGDINGNAPNVFAELTWEDLGIVQVALNNVTRFHNIYIRGTAAYG